MAFELIGLTKYCARAAAILVVAGGMSACSAMPSWLGGSDTPPVTADDQADQEAAANTATPDLAGVPEKPAAPSTADDQKALSDSLGSDRSQNQYSSDALRGGTEAAAPPPGAAPPPDQTADASAPPPAAAPDQTADASAPSQPAAAPPPSASPPDTGTIDAAAAANASSAVQSPPPPATADNSSAPASAAAPTSQIVPPPSSGAGPAVPMNSYGTYGASSMVAPSDAALGFKPSNAPPLDPSVAQFVPQPVIARYQQTASMSGTSGVATGYDGPAVRGPAMGGPEHMSGAVVANFDSLQGGGMPSAYTNGMAPSASVAFSGDTTILDARAKSEVRAAASAFQQGGGQGFVRVVGHSSSAGTRMSAERQLVWNFERSQARATAVARELIKDGVPAEKVLVQAAGDQSGSRSADIFLQS